MNTLEMYKRLSNEDKTHLTVYCIYDSIYDVARNNNILNEIKNRIKNNLRDISKYETKIKNTKSNLEKESYKILVISLKNETSFLENIIKEEEQNERETGNTKTV